MVENIKYSHLYAIVGNENRGREGKGIVRNENSGIPLILQCGTPLMRFLTLKTTHTKNEEPIPY